MTDSSEDNEEKLQYLRADLLQANTPPRWKVGGYGVEDDDSNNLFMSEPSVSEADDSLEHHMRLLSPLGSFNTEDEEGQDGPDYLPPPPPPARLLATPQAPSSPGNTSLSSWESPHFNQHRIHLHFSPGGDSLSHKADISVQSNGQQQQQHQSSQRTSPHQSNFPQYLQHSDPYLASGLIPPSSGAKTPERSYVHSSNSTSPASEGQRRILVTFLDDLRVNSEGKVQDATNNTSFGSSVLQGAALDLNGVLRTQPIKQRVHKQEPQQHSRISSLDTVVVGHTTDSEGGNNSSEAKGTTDETVVMVLSDDSGDDTKQTTAEHTTPLDWEEKASADNEKTTERRHRTIRSTRSQGGGGGRGGVALGGRGHRRQRSGDAAAATLSTGSKEWRGMEQDKIPLPPVPGGHDDDEDDDDEQETESKPVNTNNRNKMWQTDKINREDGKANKETPSQSGQTRSPEKQKETSPTSKFALGTGGQEGSPAHWRPSRIRYRRDSYRGRKTSGVVLDSEDSSSLASADPSPHVTEQQTLHASHASLPASVFSGYMPSPDWSIPQTRQHIRKTSQPVYWPPQSYYSSFNYDYDQRQNATSHRTMPMAPMLHQQAPMMRANSLDFVSGGTNDVGIDISHPTIAPMNDMNAWAHNSMGSIGSSFSWISGRNQNVSNSQAIFPDSEMSPLLGAGIKNYDRPNPSKPTVDSMPPYEFEPAEPAKAERSVNFSPLLERGKKVFNNSTLSEIGKRFNKADRRRFLPSSGLEDEDQNHSTFVCPICKTRQREFFTVSNAPRQFESASGYIAFYFGIYVIAALYIFGLQEGWGKLDCIYFAVITLTTAGLGDFVPTSDGAKVVCSIFIYFGVACIGLLLGSYIAGMLDESSRRAARANRIKSCPTCVRIQNIRDAAERRRKQFRRQKKEFQQNNIPTSEATGEGDPSGHDAKRVKRQHLASFQDQIREFTSSERINALAPRVHKGDHFRTTSSADLEMSPRLGAHSPMPAFEPVPDESPSSHSVPLTRHSPRYAPSSPSTRQILRRQTHSRHASIDSNGGTSSAGLGLQTGPRRKYSADLGIPATIPETPGTQTSVPPPPHQSVLEENESSKGTNDTLGGEDNDCDDDDSTIYSSEDLSSDSSASLNLEDEFNGVKNARYVFLTLREALINSLVIIGTGCFGFYFIEGFSFIDSWYFTTVLLTVSCVQFGYLGLLALCLLTPLSLRLSGTAIWYLIRKEESSSRPYTFLSQEPFS